ncbi:MAG: PQQ-binding-like beta-propeller repeat protein, partial [bacterium]
GVQLWAINNTIPGGPKGDGSLVCDENKLVLEGTKISGTMRLRKVSHWGPAANLGTYDMTMNGNIDDGSYEIVSTKGVKATGKFKGSISTEEELAKTNSFAKGMGWNSYFGNGESSNGIDTGQKLVDDPKNMRHMWRSEEKSLTSWGNTADGRYASNVMFNALGGGASTPVCQNGKIYLYYYSPNKISGDNPKTAALLADIGTKKLSTDPYELDAASRFYATRADVVVVCIDGVTGKTVWKSTWPLKQSNYQTHKWRGMNFTPVIADGTLYVTDYNNRSYAYDADTGDLKWEYSDMAAGDIGKDAGYRGPVVAGGFVVVGGNKIVALDPKTGKQVWAAPDNGNYKKWTTDGKDYILVEGTDTKTKIITINCLDALNGKSLWKGNTVYTSSIEYPLVSGDYSIGYRTLTDAPIAGTDGYWKVVAYKLTLNGLQLAWESEKIGIVDKIGLAATSAVVYASGANEVFALDINDGKQLGKIEGIGGARTQHMQVFDGRVLLDPEGRHGKTTLFFLNADPKDFKKLGSEWSGGYRTTTAYAVMPLYQGVDDGRLFIRGGDGIYGFDMRAPK